MHNTPTYRRWGYMKRRCKSDPNYTRNGTTVCEEWANDFAAFLRDMGEVPEGMTLDRIDGTKGYEPGNCRWATYAEQNRNRSTNVWVGDKTAADVAKENGLFHSTVTYRLKHGLPVDAPKIKDRGHCKKGHPWIEENTYYATTKRKQGGTRTQRYCRKCRAEHQRERRTSITSREQLRQLNPKRIGDG